jgi:hypothetical protein
MELQEILSKMEADGWEISDDFKTAHKHFLQYFIETVETALRQPYVIKSVCDVCDSTTDKPTYKLCDKHYSEYKNFKQTVL